MIPPVFRYILLFVDFGCIVYLIFLLKKEIKLNSVLNFLLVFASLLVVFLVLEFSSMFIAKSHGIGSTLASEVWYARYWVTNKFDFRDDEPQKDSKNDWLVVGDSFTAGSGLKDVTKRFTNLLQAKAKDSGKNLHFYNLGYENNDTKNEFDFALLNFLEKTAIKPEGLVLQYFGNDIELTAMEMGLNMPNFDFYANIPSPVVRIIENSYFFNYLYFYVNNPLGNAYDSYVNYFEQAYSNPKIVTQHFNDLQKFKDYADENKLPFIVLIIPFLHELEDSEALYGALVERYCKDHNIACINLCNNEAIKMLPVQDRIISFHDLHASEQVQVLIADELWKKL
jgi:hypothetical protein